MSAIKASAAVSAAATLPHHHPITVCPGEPAVIPAVICALTDPARLIEPLIAYFDACEGGA